MTAVKNVLHKVLLIIRDKKYRLFLFMAAAFIFSFILYVIFYPGTKKLLFFESLDVRPSDAQSLDFQALAGTPLYAEKRFIPRNRTKSSLEYFCGELLLGPVTDRYRPLFAAGTRGQFFFNKRKKTLYIDLNEGALFQDAVSSETRRACALLEQNIRKNYNSVDTIVITMMGHEVYEYTD